MKTIIVIMIIVRLRMGGRYFAHNKHVAFQIESFHSGV